MVKVLFNTAETSWKGTGTTTRQIKDKCCKYYQQVMFTNLVDDIVGLAICLAILSFCTKDKNDSKEFRGKKKWRKIRAKGKRSSVASVV